MDVKVVLTDDLDEFVRTRVASGRNASAGDVVIEALRLMERHEETESGKLAWLRNAYREGLASGDAGPFDIADVKAEARRHRG